MAAGSKSNAPYSLGAFTNFVLLQDTAQSNNLTKNTGYAIIYKLKTSVYNKILLAGESYFRLRGGT